MPQKAWIAFSCVACFAMGAQITPRQHDAIHNDNFRPTQRLIKKQKARSMAKITRKEALEKAYRHCGKDLLSIVLTHRTQRLYYDIRGKRCHIEIDAIDGSLRSIP